MSLAVRYCVAALIVAVLTALLAYPPGGLTQQPTKVTNDRASRSVESVQAELDTVLKELERTRARVVELTQTLENALAKLDILQQELEGKDNAIAALRAELAQAEEALAKAKARAAQLSAVAINTPQPAPVQTPVVQAPVPPIARPTPPPDSSIIGEALAVLDSLPVDPILLGGGLAAIVVLLALTALVKRRRSIRQGLEEIMLTRELGGGATISDESLDTALTEILEPPPTAPTPRDTHTTSPPGADEQTDNVSTLRTKQPDQDAPLQEANVYIAYERFDQAEVTMRNAITTDPERHQYKIKLLEVFFEGNQRTAFDETLATYEQLFTEQPSLGEQANALQEAFNRKSTADVGMPPGGPSGTLVDGMDIDIDFDVISDDANSALDVDFSLGLDDEPLSTAGSDNTDGRYSSRVDFDLDLTEAAMGQPTGATSSLDFDLTVSDLDTSAGALDPRDSLLDFDLGFAVAIPAENEVYAPLTSNDPSSAHTDPSDSGSADNFTLGPADSFDRGVYDDAYDLTTDDWLDSLPTEAEQANDADALEADQTDTPPNPLITTLPALANAEDSEEPSLGFELGIDEDELTADLSAMAGTTRPSLLDAALTDEVLDDNPLDYDLLVDNPLGDEFELEDSQFGDISFHSMETVVGQPSSASIDHTGSSSSMASAMTGRPETEFELDLGIEDSKSVTTSDDGEIETITLTSEFNVQEEIETQLDLAREYISLGDAQSAQDVLNDVIAFGNKIQAANAKALLQQIKPNG